MSNGLVKKDTMLQVGINVGFIAALGTWMLLMFGSQPQQQTIPTVKRSDGSIGIPLQALDILDIFGSRADWKKNDLKCRNIISAKLYFVNLAF